MAHRVTNQPQGDQWMSTSHPKNPSSDSSYSLSILTSISKLFIQQEASLGQTITGLSTAQRFQIYNQQGQLVFYAAEDQANTLHRFCCAAHRAFVLHVVDQTNQEVIRISREFKCCAGCRWCAQADCCAYEALIESPPGVFIGKVRQTRSYWRSHMSLMDATGTEHLRLVGPCCICQGVCCCCCENKFSLYTSDGDVEIGGIFKEYAGVVNQALTGAEKYTIAFPIEMPVQTKAVALGALFLVNLMHFGGNADQKGGTSILRLCC